MVGLIASAISFIVGVFMFGWMLFSADFDHIIADGFSMAMILVLIDSCLTAIGLVTFGYQWKRRKIKQRARILKDQDFFYVRQDGLRSRFFDFEAFLADLNAHDISVYYKDGRSWVRCRFGRTHYSLDTHLVESGGATFNVVTTLTVERRKQSKQLASGGAEALIYDHEYRNAVFSEEIFKHWRREVKHAAKHYKDAHFNPLE